MTKYKKEAQEGAKTNEEVHCILIRWVKLVICLQSGLVQGHILSIFSLLVEDLALCLFLSPTHTHTHMQITICPKKSALWVRENQQHSLYMFILRLYLIPKNKLTSL